MGGRGASSGSKPGDVDSKPFAIPKNISKSVLDKLSRNDIENLATAIFANNATKSGLSQSEGVYRARSLMSGNTTNQLKKYILKNK